MASMSLPRVLQQRKSSFEIEREHFEKCQAVAITKAINNIESPVKQKHVRSAIIGTFHEKNARTFWMVVLRLPLLEDRIVAWKFCHVLHKLMREGHPSVLLESNKHCDQLRNIGKLWVHLQDCYGKLIQLYSGLVLCKLDFHKRNPRVPGNLSLTDEELESIGDNDINNYFQICVEMFDYMDAVLELQHAVFCSIDRSRSNSMTSSGQCRLSPLVPCIQDASRLYDLCVKVLFKLHLNLPPDVLVGHRDRFLKQFRDLKQFYQLTHTLQYFKNLITIPVLPDNPPNFLVQSERHTYVTPVVIVPADEPEPEPEPEPDATGHEASLIDTTDSFDQENHAYLTRLLADRERLIFELQQENKALSLEIQRITKEHKKIIDGLHQQLNAFETDLATCKSELTQERQLKEDLLHEVSSSTQCQDAEQRMHEEKFHKLKEVYTKLREEHIALIRQKANVDKKLQAVQRENADLETRMQESEGSLRELSQEQSARLQSLQQSYDAQVTELRQEQHRIQQLTADNEELEASVVQLQDGKARAEVQLAELGVQRTQADELNAELHASLRSLDESLDKLRRDGAADLQLLFRSCVAEAEATVRRALDEADNPALPHAATCTPEHLGAVTQAALDALQPATASGDAPLSERCALAVRLGHVFAMHVFQGCATAGGSPDIALGEDISDRCKSLGRGAVRMLRALGQGGDVAAPALACADELHALLDLAHRLARMLQKNDSDVLADLVETELSAMDKAIEEAAQRIQQMLDQSRAADSGVQLQVNEKILDSCTGLIQAIRQLVRNARCLQEEIVSQGRGSASVTEFYKRNHRWSEGFISAAKAVGSGAGFLLSAADKMVAGQGKLELITVAAQEIAASTAQLVVASRVKADRNSHNLQQLSQTSRKVTNATGEVVATVKNCNQIMEEADEFDASGLTLHAAKRLEMDTQVRILEMEKELEQSRYKLSALRRQHYKLAGEVEGWDE